MNSLSFLQLIADQIVQVEDLMRSQASAYHPDLEAALEHLILSGGKRVRPAITLLSGRMLGGDPQKIITLAAAIELLHTATLVHDDLIDGSLLRRGNPTLNAHWSTGATVLAGDFIFARAAHLAAATESVQVMKLFSQTLTRIVNGEIEQLFSSHCIANREEYYHRIYAKTASLFETCTLAAAFISPVDGEAREEMRLFGYHIGMAFQMIDDILDFIGDEQTLGKPVGGDLRQGIVTLPVLLYLDKYPSDPIGKKLLDGECPKDESLTRFIDAIRQSGAIEQAQAEAIQLVKKGQASLNKLPASPERQALSDTAEYFVSRDL